MKVNVPSKINLGGQTIRTEVKETIPVEGAIGCYKIHENLIQLQTHVNGIAISKEQVEQTYWHEYAHAILSACRQEELSCNEELVDLMGEFLYQSIGKKGSWK